MLTAKLDNQLIDLRGLSRSEIIKKYQPQLPYVCPHCQGEVILKYGVKKRAHFAHKIPCDYQYSEAESEEHITAKLLLSSYLRSQGAHSVSVEKRFQDILRIADLYFEWNGKSYVIEIQKSIISTSLFESRMQDYRLKGIEVIWIFIGDLKEKTQTYVLNQVMKLNKNRPLIHLNILTKEVTIFNQLIWLNSKEVKGQIKKNYLKHLLISELINPIDDFKSVPLSEWLEIKKEFRVRKWQYYMKSEKRLLRFCYSHRLTLSLFPAEIGWPVRASQSVHSPIFIWQSYVLIGFIMSEKIGSVFTLTDLMNGLKIRCELKLERQAVQALKDYLALLIDFGILVYENGYYEYIKIPIGYSELDQALNHDLRLGNYLKQNKKLA